VCAAWFAVIAAALPYRAPAQEAERSLAPIEEESAVWRVRGEYLYWWTNGNPLPPLVTTSPPGTPISQAGVLGTSGVQTLFGGQSIDSGARSGGRVTLSRWVEELDDTAVEFVGFFLADDYQSGDFVKQSSGSRILARPFVNANSGQEDSELVAFPGQLAGQITVASYSEAYSAAGLVRRTIGVGPGGRIDALGGYRYFRFRENLAIRENLISTNTSGLIPLGTTTDLVDRFAVGNDFHGGEFGLAGEWFVGSSVSLELLTKVALGGLFRQAAISGKTITTIPGVAPFSTPGGLLALPTNSGVRSNNGFGVLPELNLNMTVLISPRVTFLTGYTLIVLNDVLRTGDQIDRVVNPSQLGGQPLQGPPRPAFDFHHSTLVMQGLNFGIDYRW
jgi:hypothetical protein